MLQLTTNDEANSQNIVKNDDGAGTRGVSQTIKEAKTVKPERILCCGNPITNTPLHICVFSLYFVWTLFNIIYSIYSLIIWIFMYEAWWIDYKDDKTLIDDICNGHYDDLVRIRKDEGKELGKISFGDDTVSMISVFSIYIFVLLLLIINRTIAQRYIYNSYLRLDIDDKGIDDLKLIITIGLFVAWMTMYSFIIAYNAEYFNNYDIVLKYCNKNSSLYKSVDNSLFYYYFTIVNFIFNGVLFLAVYIRYPIICQWFCDCCYYGKKD